MRNNKILVEKTFFIRKWKNVLKWYYIYNHENFKIDNNAVKCYKKGAFSIWDGLKFIPHFYFIYFKSFYLS